MDLYTQWTLRPRHLMRLSFDEWKSGDRDASPAVVTPIRSSARPRHVQGEMNGLEKRYAAHLDIRKAIGEVLHWSFEPLKLRLAPKTYFDIDFLLLMADHSIEMHEAKGHWEDDARVKIKMCPALFPWAKFVGVQWDKVRKDWKYEEFHG